MKTCNVDGCDRLLHALGLCIMHYHRLHRRGGDPSIDARQHRPRGTCSMEDCDRPHYGRGFCQMHYNRWRKHGDPNAVARPAIPPPVPHVDDRGYVRLRAPDHPTANRAGWTYLHRMVWYDAHGPIPGGYDVHHIDGDGSNNALDNLMLVDKAEHTKEHARIDSAIRAFHERKQANTRH